ncbi:MAG: YdeI/OmpD-associated family protein [Microcella sp.]|uniref:YdeI/OmpD-associated family protein n=1 Tax=Microcella sp. TaxID=1913979 RepID=UPI00331469B3
MVANDQKPVMLFERVEHWEEWLEAHPDHPGVRLKMRKKASTAPGIAYAEALESALCFGWIDGQIYRLDDDYSLQVFTPRRPRSVWSQRNVAIVDRLTAEGRMRPPGLVQVERAQEDGRWDAAYRQKGAIVPDDLQAALDASPAAAQTFAGLGAQARFGVIFRLNGGKRAETRQRKIEGYIESLARGVSPL